MLSTLLFIFSVYHHATFASHLTKSLILRWKESEILKGHISQYADALSDCDNDRLPVYSVIQMNGETCSLFMMKNVSSDACVMYHSMSSSYDQSEINENVANVIAWHEKMWPEKTVFIS